ncbi:MAG TPA: hypothetical protein VNA04_18695 [Thermoanaerobaculia bacterium]|nr:hypothetical protein [Thermoanaerobaculia bacterium]
MDIMMEPKWLNVTAVLSLIAAAILWFALFEKGFTMGGVVLPAFITVLGIFWLLVASRAKSSEDPRKANSGPAA